MMDKLTHVWWGKINDNPNILYLADGLTVSVYWPHHDQCAVSDTEGRHHRQTYTLLLNSPNLAIIIATWHYK